MSTAADLIILALKDIQVLDESETPSAALMADSLTTLNQMLAMWKIDNVNVPAQTVVSFTPNGTATHTIGVGGDVNIANPQHIDHLFLRTSGIDYPITLLPSLEQYQNIGLKSISTYPDYAYYNPTYPLGTLYLYPIPSVSIGIIHMTVPMDFPAYAASADSISLRPEYDLAIRFNLAVILAEMMGRQARPGISLFARNSLRLLKKANLRIDPLDSGDVMLPGFARIQRGY